MEILFGFVILAFTALAVFAWWRGGLLGCWFFTVIGVGGMLFFGTSGAQDTEAVVRDFCILAIGAWVPRIIRLVVRIRANSSAGHSVAHY